MTKIILSGCNGKMGKVITASLKDRIDGSIVAGIDINTERGDNFPVFSSTANCNVSADAIIDFSHPSVLESILEFAKSQKLPIVVATTGLSEAQVELIHATAKLIPVFYTANMSIGINLIIELAKKAATVIGSSFDIEIIEKHHRRKIDAPSGTALMIADAISSRLEPSPTYVYNRQPLRQKREKEELGIHSVRGGTIVGEHEIIFAGRDEVLTLSHSAQSKEIFATGSINAAIFLRGKPAGLYTMADMIGNSLV